MNRLKRERQKMVLNLLVEGNSIRGTQWITGGNRRTIINLIRSTGARCNEILKIRMVNLNCNYVECDEIWTYVQKKEARLNLDEMAYGERGDQYIFVALDRDTKLIPLFLVGKRDGYSATIFMQELRRRIYGRFQITTDQFAAYYKAVRGAFGTDVHYATLQKTYHSNGNGKREGYSPSRLQRVYIKTIIGKPDIDRICTSYVERQNLTIRTQCKRFTRLTNAFSKTLDCLEAAMAIHFWHYNFVRVHQSLGKKPAMAAGLTTTAHNWAEVITN